MPVEHLTAPKCTVSRRAQCLRICTFTAQQMIVHVIRNTLRWSPSHDSPALVAGRPFFSSAVVAFFSTRALLDNLATLVAAIDSTPCLAEEAVHVVVPHAAELVESWRVCRHSCNGDVDDLRHSIDRECDACMHERETKRTSVTSIRHERINKCHMSDDDAHAQSACSVRFTQKTYRGKRR